MDEFRQRIEAAVGQPITAEVRRALQTKIAYESLEDKGEPDDDYGTSSESRVLIKFNLLASVDPTVERFRAQLVRELADPEAPRRLDSEIERRLGWSGLRSLSARLSAWER